MQGQGGGRTDPETEHGPSHQSSTELQTEDRLSASGVAVTGHPFAQKKNITPSPTPYSETNSKSISSCCETYSQETSRSPFWPIRQWIFGKQKKHKPHKLKMVSGFRHINCFVSVSVKNMKT